MKNITLILRKNRERKGFSQEQAAQKLGISQTLFNMWESGARMPSFAQAHQLAILFDLDDDLIEYLVEAIEERIEFEMKQLSNISTLDVIRLRKKVIEKIAINIRQKEMMLEEQEKNIIQAKTSQSGATEN